MGAWSRSSCRLDGLACGRFRPSGHGPILAAGEAKRVALRGRFLKQTSVASFPCGGQSGCWPSGRYGGCDERASNGFGSAGGCDGARRVLRVDARPVPTKPKRLARPTRRVGSIPARRGATPICRACGRSSTSSARRSNATSNTAIAIRSPTRSTPRLSNGSRRATSVTKKRSRATRWAWAIGPKRATTTMRLG